MEWAGEYNGIRYVNDSKSTTVASTLWAIDHVGGPSVWILGGRDKGAEFKDLEEPLKKVARGVVVMGEARERIRKALDGDIPLVMASHLKDAIERARKLAKPGDTIVLSPTCTSFDEFEDFEERGKVFKDLVSE